MKFPESWLRAHVDVPVTTAALEHRLTMIGLEVEGVDYLGQGLDGVLVAEILRCERHPEADRLQICEVAIGNAQTLQIVCGAPNARVGLKAPLATVGTSLPGGMQIKPAKLRGVESQGMLCSAKELGLDADASGLLELPSDAQVGQSIAAHLGLPEAIIELGLTPNRGDCFSVRGIAFDVAAAFGTQVKPLAIVGCAGSATIFTPKVRLEAGRDCPRYCGRVIEGLNAQAATPDWMRQRLQRSGLRPISLLVDVTNYVMLELGQPMHAFDRDRVQGDIVVRRARDHETLSLLDGREVSVGTQYLLIADDAGPLALAGVMGGFHSRITDMTQAVFLESAHFAPDAIIGRARNLGMHTDASHRFERGVDPELPRTAIDYATQLIVDIAGGRAGEIVEAVLPEHVPTRTAVSLRRARLARLLGIEIADSEVLRVLRSLDMQVEETETGWRVTPPSRRFDIAIEEDLIEEVARIHGYDRIPQLAPSGRLVLVPETESRVSDKALREQLAARGYCEAINFAFIDAGLLETWGLQGDAIALSNPLSAELGVMRTGLLPGLAATLKRNLARQEGRPRLFELGRVFHRGPDAPVETLRVAAVATGNAEAEQWSESKRPLDFYDLKGDVESLLALTADAHSVRFEATRDSWLHPGRSADIWRGSECIGHLGFLHPRLLRALDLDQEVAVFDADVEALVRRSVPKAFPVSRFPAVRRDISVLVGSQHPWSALASAVQRCLGSRLVTVFVFDQYQGPGVEAGFRSLAMGLILQDVSRTLTDHDADHAVAEVLATLAREFGAKLRG
jgi:phenylalanyl-tRNA synthetase beta chain